MRPGKTIFLLVLVCCSLNCFSQFFKERQALIEKLSAARKDTQKVSILVELAQLTQSQNFIESYNYAKQAADISEKINYTIGRVKAYNALGDASWYHTDYAKAQDFYFRAYRLNDSLGNEVEIANSLYNIGWVICIQQQNPKEVGYLYRALQIFKTRHDSAGISKLCNAIGNYFTDRFNFTKNRASFDSALVYYNAGLAVCSYKGSLFDEHALLYGNIGDLLALSGDYKSAIFYCERSVKAFSNDGDSSSYYINIANLGSYYDHLNDPAKSIELLERALRFCERNDNRGTRVLVYKNLYHVYQKKNDSVKALSFLEKYVSLNDTMNRQIFSTGLKDRQNSYEIEKKEVDIRQLKQTNEIHKLKEERSTFFMIAAGCVALIVLSVAYLLYRQNREKTLANTRLSEQNSIITQKKQEIDKSIRYAKGIQNAVLPEASDLKKYFPESFIFYLPKDVVSGDFYWFSEVESAELGVRRESKIEHPNISTNSELRTPSSELILAAADCTGHGVPGALMSIVSMDKLNQAVFEKKLSSPSMILQFLNTEIKKALKQHGDESKQKDGLDIALLKFDISTSTLFYSGANRPLYLLRDGQLLEYRADKMAVAGFTPKDYVYQEQAIPLRKNDCIYVFSDGYADQFGGNEGRKFMTRNLKSLLGSVSTLSMAEQERRIVESHAQWKGSHEQVDDILLIGIRIT